jgi:hypothetical protein
MTSASATVPRARQIGPLIVPLANRTEPSMNARSPPPGREVGTLAVRRGSWCWIPHSMRSLSGHRARVIRLTYDPKVRGTIVCRKSGDRRTAVTPLTRKTLVA